MYCSKCGKEMKDGESYCSICGTKVGNAEKKVKNEPEYKKLEIKYIDQEVKWLINKLIYVALIYFVWRQSRKGMFEMGGYYLLSIDGLLGQVFSIKQYAGESVFIAKLCYWCFKIAIYGYLAAGVLSMIQKEDKAQRFSNIGFLLHLPIFCYSLVGVITVLESWSIDTVQLSEIFEAFKVEFLIYVVLNVVIAYWGGRIFGEISEARQSVLTREVLNRNKQETGYLKYTFDDLHSMIQQVEGHRLGTPCVYEDVSMGMQVLKFALDDEELCFLSVYFFENGFNKFSLDVEGADESHYGFVDEAQIRAKLYRKGDENKYLHEIFRDYIKENDGDTLLATIQSYITAEF